MKDKIIFTDNTSLEVAADLKGLSPKECLGDPKQSKEAKQERLNCTTHYLMSQEPSFLTGLEVIFIHYIEYAKKIQNKRLLKDFKDKKILIDKRVRQYLKNEKLNKN